jgi:hypothetical protein
MAFAGINYLAVLVAAVAAWLVGALWYTALGKAWMRALGSRPARRTGLRGAAPFVISFLAELVMAWVLAGTLGHFGPGEVTVSNGILSGALLWAGFVGTTTLVNYAFAGRSTELVLIDAGHWLAVLIVMGALIGAFGA